MAILTVRIDGRRRPEAWRTIVNRFDSQCVTCGKALSQGQEVLWRKGTGIQCREHRIKAPVGIPDTPTLDSRSYRALTPNPRTGPTL